MSGSSPAFGKWSSETALPLSRAGGSAWQIDCVLKRADFPIRYKYILKDKAGEVVPEAGADKELDVDSFARKTLAMLIVSDGYFRVRVCHALSHLCITYSDSVLVQFCASFFMHFRGH